MQRIGRRRAGRGLRPRAAGTLLACALGATPAQAATLGATVRDEGREPVADAVVYAVPLDAPAPAPPDYPETIEIDQIDKEFVPHVTAVRVGTRVSFPNRDQIRHHVYSFSEAKTFEIPLYKGVPAEPVTFGRDGEVALGCNIHDWMKAYVFVSETPWFDVTGPDGRAALELPAGAYRLQVWHPRLRGTPAETARRVEVPEGVAPEIEFAIAQKRVWRARRAPSRADPGYR